MNSTENQMPTPAAVNAAATAATRPPVNGRATPVMPAKAVRKQVAKKPAAVAVTPTPAKAIAKTPVKTAAKAPVKASVKADAKPALKPKAEKLAKAKKPKLVRDSFTIPKTEYTVIEELKERSGKLASSVKKSELIRAGIKALAAMSDRDFLGALKAVPTIKTGRPAKA